MRSDRSLTTSLVETATVKPATSDRSRPLAIIGSTSILLNVQARRDFADGEDSNRLAIRLYRLHRFRGWHVLRRCLRPVPPRCVAERLTNNRMRSLDFLVLIRPAARHCISPSNDPPAVPGDDIRLLLGVCVTAL